MIYNTKPSLLDRVLNSYSGLMQLISSTILVQSPKNFVSLATIYDGTTFIMDDGSLQTAIAIEGTNLSMVSEYVTTVNQLTEDVKGYMDSGLHRFGWYFSMDEEKLTDELENIYLRQVKAAAQKKQFIDTSILDEDVEVLKAYCHVERNILIVNTSSANLSKTEIAQIKKLRAQQSSGTLKMLDAQFTASGTGIFFQRHAALVKQIVDDFANANIVTSVVDAHEYCFDIRNAYDSAWTDPGYRVFLPGDKYPLRLSEDHKGDHSGVGTPSLKDQLISRMIDVKYHAMGTVGDTIYAPLSANLMPVEPRPFQKLFKSLKKDKIPFRIYFDFSPNGLSLLFFKEFLAAVLTVTRDKDNRYLVDAYKALQQIQDNGDDVLKVRISFCTWAYNNDEDLARSRREQLARKIQAWGQIRIQDVEGDVAEAMVSSLPGMSLGSIAKPLPYPTSQLMQMLPFTRQASPWMRGSRIFRTEDGKLIPFQPYSTLQTTWVKLILGPMGFGKTAELATDNFSLINHPDFNELPYIREITIGPGSKGLINTVRATRPESVAHQALYIRLQNTQDYLTNILDTFVGMRYPLSAQKATILNILSILCAKESDMRPPEDTVDVLERLVTLSYQRCAERKSQFDYTPGRDPLVDERLEYFSFTPKRNKVSWWDVVDFLATNGDMRTASLAQRNAVPTIITLIQMCNDERVTSQFASTTISGTGEPLTSFISRKLSSARDKYPIIAGRTRFDFGDARIISIDLDDVTKGEGTQSLIQSTLMYYLSFHILTTDIYIGEDSIKEMPGEVGIYGHDYRPYHENEVARLQRLPKRLCMDEVHRSKKVPVFGQLLITATLEGRKWGVDIVLASQLANAFPDEIKELYTTLIILGAGSDKNIEATVNEFKLSDSLAHHLRYSMRKPSKAGATMIVQIKTENGTMEQFLMSTKGPNFLWSINSTRNDTYVMSQLAKQIGDIEAKKLLVKRFPQGTVGDEIERRRKQIGTEQIFEDGKLVNLQDDPEALSQANMSILDDIVEDCVRYHFATYIE